MTIWKYAAAPGSFELMMPHGAEVLSAQMQGPDAVLWACVDPDEPTTMRRFVIYGTGHDMGGLKFPVRDVYVGTFQMGPLVWHLFEVP